MAGVKKILFLVGDFVEDYEIMVPYQMLLLMATHATPYALGKKQGIMLPRPYMILMVTKLTRRNLDTDSC